MFHTYLSSFITLTPQQLCVIPIIKLKDMVVTTDEENEDIILN